MALKSSNNSGVLVAIAKIETKLDILTVDVKDLKDGMKADIEFLKVDKISRSDAVRIQTEDLSRHIETEQTVKSQGERILDLEESRISYRAYIQAWVLLGGAAWTLATLLLGVWLNSKF